MYSQVRYETDDDTSQMAKTLAENWAFRGAVSKEKLNLDLYYKDEELDYPMDLVPFKDDPRFAALKPETQRRVLAGAWIAYNEKTIGVEVSIVNPACELLLAGAFKGVNTTSLKRIIAQTQVDEQFHILMCLEACLVARKRHRLEDLMIPKPRVVQLLENILEREPSTNRRNIVRLAFATVAEVTINAYLNLLANAKDIQPLNRETTALHRKDESSHNKIFRELAGTIYPLLSEEDKEGFAQGLNLGLDAFVQVDLRSWVEILEHVGVTEAEDIIYQGTKSSSSKRIVRDYSGFNKLIEELGIKEDIEFAF